MKDNKTNDLKSFHYLENGEVATSTLSTIKSQNFVDSGQYTIDVQNSYPEDIIQFFKLDTVETIEYTDSPEHVILEPVFQKFFNKTVRKKMKDIGICHKLGVLLYGKEGTGKTSTIKYYCNRLIKEQGAIVITILRTDEKFIKAFNLVKMIRGVQDNPIILVLEELEQYLDKNLGIIKIIADGILSIDNSIIFATSNEIARIPEALKKRKSRFKYALEVDGIDDVGTINDICCNLIGDMKTKEEIKTLSKSLKGSTLDDVKQKCIDIIMNVDTYVKPERKKMGLVTQQQK